MLTPGPGVKLLRMREMLILKDAALILPSALKSFVALAQLIWKDDHGQYCGIEVRSDLEK
jgi:hypothetical protein